MFRPRPHGLAVPLAALVAPAVVVAPSFAQQPMSAEQQAEVLLVGGQKAFADGNFPAADEQFKKVLEKFGNTPQAIAAKFGRGLILLRSPNPDHAAASALIAPAANDGGFRDRGDALYALAVCQRTLGLKELAKGDPGKPEAEKRFNDAVRWFRDAAGWYGGQQQPDKAGRAKCDEVDALLRLGKVKDARNAAEPFVRDPAWAKNPARPLGLYVHGLACFLDRDYPNAGRSLNQLAPFTDPGFGMHARYLVGRVLHLSGDTAEASANYDAVLADYEKSKALAVEALKQPDRFKNDPAEKARLEDLARAVPEHVAAAAFHGATLNYEAGKFADALPKFQGFAQAYPDSPLAPDAALRAGLCLVQLKQFDEALKLLNPLAEKAPRLADQALVWVGKAQLGAAAAGDPKDREARTKAAAETLRKAVEKCQQLANQNDPDAKARLPEVRFEFADALFAAGQYKDAAEAFDKLWWENQLQGRREELLQRIAAAFGAAGDHGRSDERIAEYRKLFAQGPLTPVVLFRGAENAYAKVTAALKPEKKTPPDQRKQLLDDAAGKYREVAEKYPEFERVNHARLGAGVCLAQLGDLDGAVKVLEAIPGPDRTGDVAPAAYLLADCLIRLAPAKAEDALEENILREKLTAAAQLLEGFAAGSPQSPDAPAALLKLGFCLKRLGSTLADPNERNQTLNRAREVYEKLAKDHSQSPFAAQAVLERAKVKALLGDRGGAMNDLRAFAGDEKLKQSPVAPLAALSLATLYREENNPTEAEKLLADVRQKAEPALAKDPDRADWVPLLKYHHAVALLELNRLTDARALFDDVVASAKPALAAEAALRSGQAQVAAARKSVETATEDRNRAGDNRPQRVAAEERVRRARAAIAEAGEELFRRGEAFRERQPTAEARSRMYYDAAWAFRFVAEDEVNRAWDELRKQAKGQPVERSKVPVQGAEDRAFAAYRKLIADFPETAAAIDVRLELAELLAERGQTGDAAKLLRDALDKEPTDKPVSPDTLERVRLRLGAALAATGDFPAAAAQFDAVAANDKSPYRPQALYRAGECLVSAGEFEKAAEKLKIFRDKNEYHNVGGLSDRAMLRLGQALLAAKKWDEARQAFETALQRFGNGNPFAADARYGVGAARQGAGQFDEAVQAYQAVTAATTAEVAARAQLQIGQCRLAQKKYAEAAAAFQLAAYAYDYPSVGYAAMLEAARAFAADGKVPEAERVLTKLAKDAPKDSAWAKAAAERLGALK